ncbi:voltage-dependent calcium channel gamma-5 subunit-like isoform X1 [Oncorhynchus keta]|uniref:voltage-dependent calcium channel gamma-5 subunit-like isoform X1 n=1 Tax=Oncorhynchus keta TaxID=8018 RepID=UPI0015FD6E2C|nr:voltage-dependent calcium channel gamma-5 subunit-like isoform X1 [Oncorhynchus keta]
MTLCGRKVLTVLSSVFAVCALGLLGIAVSTDYWLYLEEGVILPLNQSTELRMSLHSGLWRVCFTAGDEKGRCFTIEYVMPTNVQLTSESTVSVLTPEPILSPSCVMGPIQWEIQSAIQEALRHDPAPPDTPAGKTYVPASVRPQLMLWYHTSLSSGHPRVTQTTELLTRKFWWSFLTADVRDYVLSCPVCAWAKSPRQLPTEMIRSATPFPLVSLFFLFIGFVLSNIGHIRPHRTILAFISGIFFILSGLSLVVGLVLYISSINDEMLNRTKTNEAYFSYQYGWSFAFAAISFLLTETAGVMSVYLFMKRYTAEEMYRPHPGLYGPRHSNCSDYSGQFLHPDTWDQHGRSPSSISSEASLQMNHSLHSNYPALLKCPEYDRMSSSPC